MKSKITGIVILLIGVVALGNGIVAFVKLNKIPGDGGLGAYSYWMSGLVLTIIGGIALTIGVLLTLKKDDNRVDGSTNGS